jgi:DNA-binding MarR family transcriptional regulator
MARAVERIYREMEQVFRAHGITSPQFDVLATLTRHGPLMQQALAAHLLVTKGNVSYIVSRMEAAGLLDRATDPQDPRANRLSLTARGRALYERIMPDHDVVLSARFERLDAEALQALVRAVRTLDAES